MKTSILFTTFLVLLFLTSCDIYIDIFEGKDDKSETDSGFKDSSGTFTDRRDSKVYKWVKIGSQVWMANNLKATAYNDGTPIPNVAGAANYCWFGNDQLNYGETYGALYNWNAVNSGKLCPKGWHVPSDAEWEELTRHISNQKGPYEKVDGNWLELGRHLKTRSGWANNGNGTDDFGFSGLPGGDRGYDGYFRYAGNYGHWWSSTEASATTAWSRGLNWGNTNFDRYGHHKDLCFSIRCIKD